MSIKGCGQRTHLNWKWRTVEFILINQRLFKIYIRLLIYSWITESVFSIIIFTESDLSKQDSKSIFTFKFRFCFYKWML